MLDLDGNMIEALITTSASLLTGLLGLFLGQYKFTASRKNDLHKVQLEKVYEPLMAILLDAEISELNDDQIDKISYYMLKNNSVVAPALMEKFLSLTKRQEKDFRSFFTILAANYNWARKCLGYPCMEDQIILDFVPAASKKRIYYLFFGLIAASAGFASLFAMTNAVQLWLRIVLMTIFILSYAVCYWSLHSFIKEAGKI